MANKRDRFPGRRTQVSQVQVHRPRRSAAPKDGPGTHSSWSNITIFLAILLYLVVLSPVNLIDRIRCDSLGSPTWDLFLRSSSLLVVPTLERNATSVRITTSLRLTATMCFICALVFSLPVCAGDNESRYITPSLVSEH